MQRKLQDSLSETSATLDRVMAELLPSNLLLNTRVISLHSREEETNSSTTPEGKAKVSEAMRYSALAGGKRLRPFLTVESAKLFGVNPDAAILTAAAIEFVHTYPTRGIFITDKYTDRGKWMDGWESRRKRTPGHDWAVVQLATPGKIVGFDIDTNFFLSNHPPHASVKAINLIETSSVTDWDKLNWKEILPKSHLDAGSQNFYESNSSDIYTHIRLHINPDGGVARLRVYGEVFRNWELVSANEVNRPGRSYQWWQSHCLQ